LLGVALAMVGFMLVGTGTAYLELLPVLLVMSAGMSLTIPSMTGSIMSAVPLGKAGVGSAMNDTTRELGGALGVAVLGSLVASRYGNRLAPVIRALSAPLQGKAQESLAGALQAAGQVGGTSGQQVAAGARDAYVSGLHLAAVVGAVVTVIASLIVYHLLPSALPHTINAQSRSVDSDEELAVEFGPAV
jgi:hypothetical protein